MAPRGRRPLLRRLRRAPGAALASAWASACVAAAVALVFSAAAFAQEAPPPPATTTTEAPPPDRYTPPVKQPAAKKSAPVTDVAPQAPVRSYSPPVSRPTTRVATPKPVQRPKVVHRQRKKPKPVHRPVKPEPISLAPIAHIVAASRLPLPSANDEERPFLWLAGLAFAVLAIAGLSLQLLSLRYFRPELK